MHGGVFAAGDGPANGELAADAGVAEAAKVGEERLRAPGAVDADQDRVPVPVSVGNLLERGVEDGDVGGGGGSAAVLEPALPGRSRAARNSPVAWVQDFRDECFSPYR